MEPQLAYSYGVIPLYDDYNGTKVLIVQNSKGGHWGFPKGTPELAETSLETAMRELQEETGIAKDTIRIEEQPVFIEQYSFEQEGIRYNKTNTYYIGYVENMTIGNDLDEISNAQWVLLEEAKDIFTHAAVIQVANELADHLESLKEYNW